MYSKEQQLKSKRIKKKSKNFSEKTKQEIFERDDWRCVRCESYYIESVPHHIIYKSQGGTGEATNGATVCRDCHTLAHSRKDVRKWFEGFREQLLRR
ncbi:HNH endonuclease [Virgibacillus salexigens]|uniref:HNH endonuclease n=1 Tax=Virgibacillus massiliensis TaxID=1462526 RepID=A0A024QBA5_9BACI|nr:HNH endonuclease [Virgibacillus massiliensis]CDQ39522.1 HNH endonuclease [Virgibacillus massiliensis]